MKARAGAWRTIALMLAAVAIAQAGAADRIAYQGRLVVGNRGIVVMSANGDRPVELPHPAGSDVITPGLSPDGSALAYAARVGDHYKLWVVPLAADNSPAGEPRQLTTGDSDDEQPAWSPDGLRIAYVSASGQDRALLVVPAQGGSSTLVTQLGSDFRSACPHWSPDGSFIVFGSEGKLFIIGAAGNDEHELVGDGMYPAWSPDGPEIAFFAREPKPALKVISPETGDTRVLASEVEFFGETAWSPDGKQVAFKASRVGTADGNLWVVPAAGGPVKPLRSYGVAHGYLDWSRSPATVVAAVPAPAPAKPAPAPKLRLTQQKPAPPPAPPAPTAAAKRVKPPEALPQVSSVRIVSPAEGAVIRGMIKIRARKAEPDGYVSFFADGSFVSATIAPYETDWDTRSAADGPHTVAITGYGASGETQGRAEARVEVRNAIEEQTLPQEGALLRYRFKQGQKLEYSVTVRAQAGAQGEVPLPAVAAQGGSLEAVIVQRVEAVQPRPGARPGLAEAVATIVTQMRRGTLRAPGAPGVLPQIGRAARSTRTTEGDITPVSGPAGGTPIALGNLSLKFPADPVKVGDRWTAPMTVLPVLLSTAVARVTAEHKVEKLQWEQGREAMRIVSTFKAAALPVGVDGMALQDVSGTRTTWFAFKEHVVLRMVDELHGVFRQQFGAAATAPAAAAQSRPAGRGGRGGEEEEMPQPLAPQYSQPARPAASAAYSILHYDLSLTAVLAR
ncbi:MAG TPA: Ig-like domain-containing protein [Armatimonadota bacterium]|nr:Ig-like domain-containing protein [Armatimonadota bacterium]